MKEQLTMLELDLNDNEWPLTTITHHREIVRAIVIDKENNFYFIHLDRDDDFGKARLIETAGGGVEKNESYEMAIKRELKEELGVEVNLLTKLGLVRDYYHLINRKNHNHYYLCQIKRFGERELTMSEREDFHLSTLVVSYEKAIEAYEENQQFPLGRLVTQRELPILKHAKKWMDLNKWEWEND